MQMQVVAEYLCWKSSFLSRIGYQTTMYALDACFWKWIKFILVSKCFSSYKIPIFPKHKFNFVTDGLRKKWERKRSAERRELASRSCDRS